MATLDEVTAAAEAYADDRVEDANTEATAVCAERLAEKDAEYAALQAEFDAYKAAHPDDAPVPSGVQPIIGMSAPATDWNTRVAEVGTTGLKARRIFAQLTTAGTDKQSLIEAAVAADMLPVVSYKVPNFTTPNAYLGWADTAAKYLASLGVPVTVTIWHEPNSDMAGPQFVTLQDALVPRFKGVGQLRVGPILNGFLLAQPKQPEGVQTFTSYTSPKLMDTWDFFGIDSYQSGTLANPGPQMPASRVVALLDWLTTQGHPDMPIGVGEYNGFSKEAIAEMGEVLLQTPNTLFGCVWNVDEARAGILTGDRLAAYKATKADPRAQQ